MRAFRKSVAAGEEALVVETTAVGSLPKPSWLAEQEMPRAAWRLEGNELKRGRSDATLLRIRKLENAGSMRSPAAISSPHLWRVKN